MDYDPNELDYSGTDFSDTTVGELYALLREHAPDTHVYGRQYLKDIPTAALMMVAQAGRDLFIEAVVTAHRKGDSDFFDYATSMFGPLIDAAQDECLPDGATRM